MARAGPEMLLITKVYDLVVWSCRHVAKFPRTHRFTLGDRLEVRLYEVLEMLIRAKYTRDRRALLRSVNVELELLRFQFRIAKDLQCISIESYGYAARSVDEVGRLLGGFPNLVRAAEKAGRGKRSLAGVARFHYDLERQLCRLQDELRAHTYVPGAYRTFRIHDPKPRLISAAPYRDRVVHHALCRVIEPVFEPAFVFDSYACRHGKGTHAAVSRLGTFARRRYRYVLKCDVSRYFPSIDHDILKGLLARKLKDPDVLRLVNLIIDRSNPQEPMLEWFAGDGLFTPVERRRGLPIGNQTSQFFGNVYLNPFDHFVAETLRAPPTSGTLTTSCCSATTSRGSRRRASAAATTSER